MSQKVKVLAVDDDATILECMENFFSSEEFKVLKLTDGTKVMETVAKERPDLILLDIKMPKCDGMQLCQQLREDPKNDFVPIIMSTGVGDDSMIVRLLQYGADDYLVKPYNGPELVGKVKALLAMAKEGKLPSQEYSKKVKPPSQGEYGEIG